MKRNNLWFLVHTEDFKFASDLDLLRLNKTGLDVVCVNMVHDINMFWNAAFSFFVFYTVARWRVFQDLSWCLKALGWISTSNENMLPCSCVSGMYLSDLTYIDSAYPSTGSILENEQRSNLMNNLLRIISDLQRSCTYGEIFVDVQKKKETKLSVFQGLRYPASLFWEYVPC